MNIIDNSLTFYLTKMKCSSFETKVRAAANGFNAEEQLMLLVKRKYHVNIGLSTDRVVFVECITKPSLVISMQWSPAFTRLLLSLHLSDLDK